MITIKSPQSERLCSKSMLVPHDSEINDALASAARDYGLKPNGLTIDAMRENPEFYTQRDMLDRLAVATEVSGKLSNDVKKVVSAFKAAETDRNKTKNFI